MTAQSNITPESIVSDLRYLQLLSRSFPTIADASTEIINLEAILNLPKGTEHFLTDIHGEYELFISIMKDGESHTMIFISHRLSSVKDADRIFMLEQGRLIEEGTHRELIQFDGRYAEMYKKQAMNYLAVESVEGVAL